MNEAKFKERVRRLTELNEVIKTLDPAIRESSFELLKSYVSSTSQSSESSSGSSQSQIDEIDTSDAESFFTKFDHAKPSNNAKLISAYLYSQFGTDSFSLDEVRELADDVGLTIPERLDMTFLDSRKDGKSLYKRAGRGKFRPTVHGEKYLKETYSVNKGTKQRQDEK